MRSSKACAGSSSTGTAIRFSSSHAPTGIVVAVNQVRLIFKPDAFHVIIADLLQQFCRQLFATSEVERDVHRIGFGALVASGEIGQPVQLVIEIHIGRFF